MEKSGARGAEEMLGKISLKKPGHIKPSLSPQTASFHRQMLKHLSAMATHESTWWYGWITAERTQLYSGLCFKNKFTNVFLTYLLSTDSVKDTIFYFSL